MKYQLRRDGAYIRMAMTEMTDEAIQYCLLHALFFNLNQRHSWLVPSLWVCVILFDTMIPVAAPLLFLFFFFFIYFIYF